MPKTNEKMRIIAELRSLSSGEAAAPSWSQIFSDALRSSVAVESASGAFEALSSALGLAAFARWRGCWSAPGPKVRGQEGPAFVNLEWENAVRDEIRY